MAHHGIPSQTAAGDDVVALWESFAPLLAYARAGHGPLLLECLVRADEGEREDPIRRFQRHGVAEGWFVDDDSGSIELESRRAVGKPGTPPAQAANRPMDPAGARAGRGYDQNSSQA